MALLELSCNAAVTSTLRWFAVWQAKVPELLDSLCVVQQGKADLSKRILFVVRSNRPSIPLSAVSLVFSTRDVPVFQTEREVGHRADPKSEEEDQVDEKGVEGTGQSIHSPQQHKSKQKAVS